MKTFILIIFSLIIYSFQSQAQTQELLDNTWYLEKVVIDDEDIFVPNLGVPPIAYAEFSIDNLTTEYCDWLFADIEYSEPSNFIFTGAGVTFEGCGVEEYDVFEAIYFNDFFGSIEVGFYQPFSYEITEESSTLKKLTITNINNDQAIYYSQTLSNQDMDGFGTVKLYPNPAQNKFSIESDVDIKQIKIYNQLGQVVLEFDDIKPQPSFNISVLSKGIYFVELSSVQGKKTVKKLVKQ
jgi:hypothetical protein